MELSVREAATLMGRSPRTVRAQLARGELSGEKVDGQWRVKRRHLPLTEAQREALQRKADDVRRTVEDALPPRRGRPGGAGVRSVADLDAFRIGAEVLRMVRRETPEVEDGRRQRIEAALEASLVALSESALHFDPPAKKRALERCRAELACAVTLLLLSGDEGAASEWALKLETGMAAAVAGLARWIDGLGKRSR